MRTLDDDLGPPEAKPFPELGAGAITADKLFSDAILANKFTVGDRLRIDEILAANTRRRAKDTVLIWFSLLCALASVCVTAWRHEGALMAVCLVWAGIGVVALARPGRT